ncbi:MAG: BrnT family toxin [Chloroflexi bacterium]|nr:BrnT family toxin [Chloroflexota bacterium]
MRFEWDEAKRRANLQKHGIDFAGVEEAFEGNMVTVEDTRADYGESRFLTLGLLEGHVVLIVHTEESDVIRIISVRKATRYEETNYWEQVAH